MIKEGDRVGVSPGGSLWFAYRNAAGIVQRVFAVPANGSRADVMWDAPGPPEFGLPLASLTVLQASEAISAIDSTRKGNDAGELPGSAVRQNRVNAAADPPLATRHGPL